MGEVSHGQGIIESEFFASPHFLSGPAEVKRLEMIFEPMLLITWRKLSFIPRTMDEIPMTTATPITMPSTVSADRSLLLRIVSSDIRTISP
jgi:hypothetical protein